ncbi:MAG: magnesium transporter [Acidimicrobiia bacterium]|nr:magnesium transporter [Acidimicrobiia bacterium]MDH4306241.1 magnesium transporter [Acidimicrobiia bacterium]MDH5292749.1 magnesium transporter [Acidimicrobiia bacterium]
MRLRLRRPRELAKTLLALARRRPAEVEDYLEEHTEEWSALAEATPGDAADILEAIDEETAGELIADLDAEDAAEVLEELRDDLAADILAELPIESAAAVLERMPPDEAVDILANLDADQIEDLLGVMSDEAEAGIRGLLRYPGDSAGGLMSTDLAALPIGMTAGEAIERLRTLHEELEDLSYVYIVDEFDRLEGVLSFRELVFARPGAGLDEVMVRNPLAVSTGTDREEVADLIQRYHLFGIPVVDDHGRLVGMVDTDAVIESVQAEASEDFAAAMGAGAGETVYTDILPAVRARLPWLFVNLGLALVVAVMIEHQTGVISRHPVLAALMPVIASLGGNGGSQTLAVVIRSLATDDIPPGRVPDIMWRQVGIGAANGLALALGAALVTYALTRTGVFYSDASPVELGIVVAAATLGNQTMATFAGSGVPLFLRRLGLDPALASSIFVTLFTDMIGFAGFLLVAAALL